MGLRVKDLGLAGYASNLRNGKGGRDRCMMLPSRVAEKIKSHLEKRRLHRQGLAESYGRVRLSQALVRKYPLHRWSGAGNGCFRNNIAGKTPTSVSRGAITWIPA
jgi:hypothetical protein